MESEAGLHVGTFAKPQKGTRWLIDALEELLGILNKDPDNRWAKQHQEARRAQTRRGTVAAPLARPPAKLYLRGRLPALQFGRS